MTVWQAGSCRMAKGRRRIEAVLITLYRHLPTPVPWLTGPRRWLEPSSGAHGWIAKLPLQSSFAYQLAASHC